MTAALLQNYIFINIPYNWKKKDFYVVCFSAHFFPDFMEFSYKCEKDVSPSFVDSSLARIGVQ